MSKDGYYGDFGSFVEEQEAYRQHMEKLQEPNVVPCFKCGNQMYEENNDPRQNICEECKKLLK